LQTGILLTGNYTFFNYLTIALFTLVIDDHFWLKWIAPRKLASHLLTKISASTRNNNGATPSCSLILHAHSFMGWSKTIIVLLLMVGVFVSSLVPFSRHIKNDGLPKFVKDVHAITSPYRITNSYGLFAHMTTERDEIEVLGSNDQQNWIPYHFKYKPGDVYQAPSFVAPHQPRLDWQMWFAALSQSNNQPWFINFVAKLLEGSPAVLDLMHNNPFPGTPPKYIKAMRYRYHYTNLTSCYASQGTAWWERTLLGEYLQTTNLPSLESFREQNGWL